MVDYQPGRHLDARDGRATAMNESRFVGIEAEDGYRVAVRQIAGKVARRIVGWAGPGAKLARGERLGMIRFGSRVEIFLPPDTQVLVTPGQHVKGGETILARRPTA
jgi:phosphatidylserine decarboxylase